MMTITYFSIGNYHMNNRNLSDIIEAYLKEVLSQSEQVKIKRNEIAERFDCVPSQINYVINTRFTIQNGYLVESKRGGGGYIRIIKVQLLDDSQKVDSLTEIIGKQISEKDAFSIINTLYREETITKNEAKLMLAAMKKTAYGLDLKIEKLIRANILKNMLTSLKYE